MQKTTPEFFEWLLPIKSCTLDGAKQSNLASVRLRAALSCEALEKHGYQTAFSDGHPSKRSRAVYVGKFSDADDPQRAPRWLDFLSNKKRVGSKIIIDYTDNHLVTNSRATLFYKDAFKLADAVVCSSNVLAKHVRSYMDLPITIIPDPIEVDIEPPVEKNNPRPTALWFGHASNLSYFLSFISKLKTFDHPLDIIAITNISPIPDDALKQIESAISPSINVSFLGWSPDVLTAAGKIADFCIIPAGLHDPKKDGASSNRLLTALAMGLPVLADPLASYLEFKGFFRNLDTNQLLEITSNSPGREFPKILAAQDLIRRKFTKSVISSTWIKNAIGLDDEKIHGLHSNLCPNPIPLSEIYMNFETSASLSGYVIDDDTGVFVRPGNKGIGYRDGGEGALLKIIESVHDRSTLSSELIHHMNDWPSEYHFSRKRHLVLRPFDIKRGDRVLELGSGCGSITRYLAEIGAQVTAVEGELARSAVAAKRCEGFDNVRFIADNFLSLDLQEKFDWVLMIGVLEYSQKYGTSINRQQEYLEIARNHLKHDGTLVIAIENKIGLKYFNGAGEDHNGKRFYGPQDLYGEKDITTWGRTELQEILLKAGFKQSKFFAAFPDYKLPKIILTEHIDEHRHFRAEELLHYTKSLDYRGKNERIFDESLVMASLRKNGLMIDMCNSFLISCHLNDLHECSDAGVLAHYFSVDRHRSLCTHTQFIKGIDNKITVCKVPIDADHPHEERPVFASTNDGYKLQLMQYKNDAISDYYDGRLLGYDITKALKKEDAEQFKSLLEQWVTFLLNNFRVSCRKSGQHLKISELKSRPLSSVMIDGIAIDCGPQNIVRGESTHAFDLEWRADKPVPFAWVLNRNAKHVMRLRHSNVSQIKVTDIVGFISETLGMIATTEDIDEANLLETQFQAGIALVEPSNIRPLTTAFNLT